MTSNPLDRLPNDAAAPSYPNKRQRITPPTISALAQLTPSQIAQTKDVCVLDSIILSPLRDWLLDLNISSTFGDFFSDSSEHFTNIHYQFSNFHTKLQYATTIQSICKLIARCLIEGKVFPGFETQLQSLFTSLPPSLHTVLQQCLMVQLTKYATLGVKNIYTTLLWLHALILSPILSSSDSLDTPNIRSTLVQYTDLDNEGIAELTRQLIQLRHDAVTRLQLFDVYITHTATQSTTQQINSPPPSPNLSHLPSNLTQISLDLSTLSPILQHTTPHLACTSTSPIQPFNPRSSPHLNLLSPPLTSQIQPLPSWLFSLLFPANFITTHPTATDHLSPAFHLLFCHLLQTFERSINHATTSIDNTGLLPFQLASFASVAIVSAVEKPVDIDSIVTVSPPNDSMSATASTSMKHSEHSDGCNSRNENKNTTSKRTNANIMNNWDGTIPPTEQERLSLFTMLLEPDSSSNNALIPPHLSKYRSSHILLSKPPSNAAISKETFIPNIELHNQHIPTQLQWIRFNAVENFLHISLDQVLCQVQRLVYNSLYTTFRMKSIEHGCEYIQQFVTSQSSNHIDQSSDQKTATQPNSQTTPNQTLRMNTSITDSTSSLSLFTTTTQPIYSYTSHTHLGDFGAWVITTPLPHLFYLYYIHKSTYHLAINLLPTPHSTLPPQSTPCAHHFVPFPQLYSTTINQIINTTLSNCSQYPMILNQYAQFMLSDLFPLITLAFAPYLVKDNPLVRVFAWLRQSHQSGLIHPTNSASPQRYTPSNDDICTDQVFAAKNASQAIHFFDMPNSNRFNQCELTIQHNVDNDDDEDPGNDTNPEPTEFETYNAFSPWLRHCYDPETLQNHSVFTSQLYADKFHTTQIEAILQPNQPPSSTTFNLTTDPNNQFGELRSAQELQLCYQPLTPMMFLQFTSLFHGMIFSKTSFGIASPLLSASTRHILVPQLLKQSLPKLVSILLPTLALPLPLLTTISTSQSSPNHHPSGSKLELLNLYTNHLSSLAQLYHLCLAVDHSIESLQSQPVGSFTELKIHPYFTLKFVSLIDQFVYLVTKSLLLSNLHHPTSAQKMTNSEQYAELLTENDLDATINATNDQSTFPTAPFQSLQSMRAPSLQPFQHTKSTLSPAMTAFSHVLSLLIHFDAILHYFTNTSFHINYLTQLSRPTSALTMVDETHFNPKHKDLLTQVMTRTIANSISHAVRNNEWEPLRPPNALYAEMITPDMQQGISDESKLSRVQDKAYNALIQTPLRTTDGDLFLILHQIGDFNSKVEDSQIDNPLPPNKMSQVFTFPYQYTYLEQIHSILYSPQSEQSISALDKIHSSCPSTNTLDPQLNSSTSFPTHSTQLSSASFLSPTTTTPSLNLINFQQFCVTSQAFQPILRLLGPLHNQDQSLQPQNLFSARTIHSKQSPRELFAMITTNALHLAFTNHLPITAVLPFIIPGFDPNDQAIYQHHTQQSKSVSKMSDIDQNGTNDREQHGTINQDQQVYYRQIQLLFPQLYHFIVHSKPSTDSTINQPHPASTNAWIAWITKKCLTVLFLTNSYKTFTLAHFHLTVKRILECLRSIQSQTTKFFLTFFAEASVWSYSNFQSRRLHVDQTCNDHKTSKLSLEFAVYKYIKQFTAEETLQGLHNFLCDAFRSNKFNYIAVSTMSAQLPSGSNKMGDQIGSKLYQTMCQSGLQNDCKFDLNNSTTHVFTRETDTPATLFQTRDIQKSINDAIKKQTNERTLELSSVSDIFSFHHPHLISHSIQNATTSNKSQQLHIRPKMTHISSISIVPLNVSAWPYSRYSDDVFTPAVSSFVSNPSTPKSDAVPFPLLPFLPPQIHHILLQFNQSWHRNHQNSIINYPLAHSTVTIRWALPRSDQANPYFISIPLSFPVYIVVTAIQYLYSVKLSKLQDQRNTMSDTASDSTPSQPLLALWEVLLLTSPLLKPTAVAMIVHQLISFPSAFTHHLAQLPVIPTLLQLAPQISDPVLHKNVSLQHTPTLNLTTQFILSPRFVCHSPQHPPLPNQPPITFTSPSTPIAHPLPPTMQQYSHFNDLSNSNLSLETPVDVQIEYALDESTPMKCNATVVGNNLLSIHTALNRLESFDGEDNQFFFQHSMYPILNGLILGRFESKSTDFAQLRGPASATLISQVESHSNPPQQQPQQQQQRTQPDPNLVAAINKQRFYQITAIKAHVMRFMKQQHQISFTDLLQQTLDFANDETFIARFGSILTTNVVIKTVVQNLLDDLYLDRDEDDSNLILYVR